MEIKMQECENCGEIDRAIYLMPGNLCLECWKAQAWDQMSESEREALVLSFVHPYGRRQVIAE